MFRILISASIRAGANQTALQQAQEISNYVNEQFGSYLLNKVQFGLQVFGHMGNIVWFSDIKNMTLLEEYRQKIMADKGYQDRVNKLSGVLIEGTANHDIFEIT